MPGNVDPEDIMVVMQAHLGGIMESLGQLARNNELTADDLVDFFLTATGAVLDNDTNLKTPRDFRLAGAELGKQLAQRAMELRQFSDQTGMSALDAIRSGIPLQVGTKPADG